MGTTFEFNGKSWEKISDDDHSDNEVIHLQPQRNSLNSHDKPDNAEIIPHEDSRKVPSQQ